MTDDYTPSLDEALTEGMKVDARNRMRHDPRVWHEALEDAIGALLPPLIEAVRAEERQRAAQIVGGWEPLVDQPHAIRVMARRIMGSDVGETAWEYGHQYVGMDGEASTRPVSALRFAEHRPSGHRADGSPYWNYTRMRRRPAGPWEEAPDA